VVPQCLIDEGNYLPRTTRVPQRTYYDREYAALELEHVWKKCWQLLHEFVEEKIAEGTR
jgi:hypothetical protein